MTANMLFQLSLPYVSGLLAIATLAVCGMGAIQQRPAVVRFAWLFAALSLGFCGRAVAGPDVTQEGPIFSRAALVMASVIFGIGVLVQWAAIAADGRRLRFSRFVGSVALAGFGGAVVTLVSMDQLRSPAIAAALGVGAAYAGGAAVLKRFGAGAEQTASDIAAKEKERA